MGGVGGGSRVFTWQSPLCRSPSTHPGKAHRGGKSITSGGADWGADGRCGDWGADGRCGDWGAECSCSRRFSDCSSPCPSSSSRNSRANHDCSDDGWDGPRREDPSPSNGVSRPDGVSRPEGVSRGSAAAIASAGVCSAGSRGGAAGGGVATGGVARVGVARGGAAGARLTAALMDGTPS